MTRTRRTSNGSHKDRVVVTPGEVFADAVIDLVGSADGCRPNLILWDGERATVAPQLQYRGITYQGPELHSSMGQAIRFPTRVNRGGTAELFAEVTDLFQKYVGVLQEIAQALSLWNAGTWLSDVLPSPPALAIVGPDMSLAVILFDLLSAISRRALRLTGISRAAFVGLPMHLRPTCLINQPDLPRSVWELCRASNHRGVRVPGKDGAVLDWVCSKAIFFGMAIGANPLSGEALWVSLPPADPGLPILDELTLARIAHDLQARFLGFRFDWLKREWETPFPDRTLSFGGNELAQNLFASVRHEPELIRTVTPLLHSQEEEAMARRQRHPSSVILEVIWHPAHQGGKLTLKKITECMNVLLHIRGEKYVYQEEEVGWKLKQLGIERHRNGSGMVLRFSGGNTRLVHQLARKLGLQLPKMEGCSDCAEPEIIAPVHDV